MSRLYVDRVQANTTDGDVMLETNLIVSGTSGDRTIQIDNNAANSANLQIIAPAGSTLLFGNILRRFNASFGRCSFCCAKQINFEPFIYKNDLFTKTGSGQTQQE